MDSNLKNSPFVSIIMPVYNTEKFLREAIESILTQTYSNFEFIIINDGSTDKSREIILSYHDPRIIFLDNQSNRGLVAVMNDGISRATGTYIIRSDADDVSLPRRIEQQVSFMEHHQEVGILSAWMRTIGEKSSHILDGFLKHEDILANLLFNTSIAQPAVCIRTSVLKKLSYDNSFKDGAEDYDLWVRASKITKIASIPKVLVLYRVHPGNISMTKLAQNQANTRIIRDRLLKELGIIPTTNELSLHSSIVCKNENISRFLVDQEKWMRKIILLNSKKLLYKNESLNRVIRHRWFLICDANARMGLGIFFYAFKPPFAFQLRDIGIKSFVKFILKVLLRK